MVYPGKLNKFYFLNGFNFIHSLFIFREQKADTDTFSLELDEHFQRFFNRLKNQTSCFV